MSTIKKFNLHFRRPSRQPEVVPTNPEESTSVSSPRFHLVHRGSLARRRHLLRLLPPLVLQPQLNSGRVHHHGEELVRTRDLSVRLGKIFLESIQLVIQQSR